MTDEPGDGDARFLERHRVAAFFALTLATSWTLWLPLAAGADLPVGPLLVAGGFGPMLAAGVVTWLTGDSLRAWLAPVARWRFRPALYLLAVGGPVVAVAVESAVYAAAENPLDLSVLPDRLAVYALNLLFVAVLGGGQEEFGWRGFALPHLQARHDGLVASLAIGVAWAVWHLPLFAVPASSQSGVPAVPYVVSVLAMSVVFTWLYNASGGSLLSVVVLHAGVNASSTLYPVATATLARGIPDALVVAMAVVTGVAALLLVALYGRSLGLAAGPDRRPAGSDGARAGAR